MLTPQDLDAGDQGYACQHEACQHRIAPAGPELGHRSEGAGKAPEQHGLVHALSALDAVQDQEPQQGPQGAVAVTRAFWHKAPEPGSRRQALPLLGNVVDEAQGEDEDEDELGGHAQALHGVGRRGRVHACHERREEGDEGVGLEGDEAGHGKALLREVHREHAAGRLARHRQGEHGCQEGHEDVDPEQARPKRLQVGLGKHQQQERERKAGKAGAGRLERRQGQRGRQGQGHAHPGIGAREAGWACGGFVEHSWRACSLACDCMPGGGR